jgi:hypothetical protein
VETPLRAEQVVADAGLTEREVTHDRGRVSRYRIALRAIADIRADIAD